MQRSLLAAALAVVWSISGCSSRVDSTNPFDPGTPSGQKAKAAFRGRLVQDPLAGATAQPLGAVLLTLGANNVSYRQQPTLADGTFLFSDLPPGSYVLQAAPQGLVPLSLPLTLAPGDDVDLHDVQLALVTGPSLGTLAGKATLGPTATDNSGILVETVVESGPTFSTQTNTAGAWSLSVAAGSYSLRFSHKDFKATTTAAPVAVTAGGALQVPEVALVYDPATVIGAVDAELAAGGTAPLADATVTLDNTGVTGVTGDAAPDVGKFALTGIPAGSYVLRALKAGYDPATVPVLNLAGHEVRTLPAHLVLALSRGGIAGTVALAGSADASGVTVQLAGGPTADTAITGPGGRYSFTGVLVGNYSLTLSKDGYLAGTIPAVTVESGKVAAPADTTLAANPATLTGSVTGELPGGGAGPLVGAQVSVDGTSAVGVTDAAGAFSLGGVQLGSYVVRATLAGYEAQTQPALNLAGGESRALPAFVLKLSRGGISGAVTLAGSADASGVLIQLSGASSANLTTGPDGAYTFPGLVTGVYSVAASKPGYQPLTLQAAVTVKAGLVAAVAQAALQPNPGSLSGHVDGELASGSSAPLAGATVSLDGGPTTLTDAGGHFNLASVPVGTWIARVAKAGYDTQTQVVLGLAGGEARVLSAPFALKLSRGQIAGAVSLSDSPSDASGVLVQLSGGPSGGSFVTAGDGKYSFGALLAGVYTVTASRAGYLGVTLGAAVTVAAGAVATPGPGVLQPNPASVLGHVTAENTSGGVDPLAGATISLDGLPGATTQTNVSGDFTLSMPVGSYVLRVSKAGFGDQTQAVLNLSGGEQRTLQNAFYLTLLRGSIAGNVKLPDNADGSGTIVELTGATRALVTGQDGNYRFDNLLSGLYQVTARHDGYQRKVLASAAQVSGTGTTSVPSATLDKQGGAVTVAPYTKLRQVQLSLNAPKADSYLVSEDQNFLDPAQGEVRGTSTPHAFGGTGTATFTLTDADGLHNVYVLFFAAGVPAPLSSAQTVLDRVAPSSPAISINGGSAFTNAPGGIVTLSLSALDAPPAAAPNAQVSGVGQMRLANDNVSVLTATAVQFNRTATWTLDTPGNQGAKKACVVFIDNALNESAPACAQVIYDTIAPASPSVALTGPASSAAGYTSSSIITVALGATDANGGAGNANLLVRLSNTAGFAGAVYQPFQASLTWLLPPGDGTKTVYAQYLDAAGNASIVVSSSIALDTAPPGTPRLTLTETDSRPANGYTNNLSVTLNLSVAPEPGAAQVNAVWSEDPSFSGAALSLISSGATVPKGLVLGGAGPRTVYARFLDLAGNASATVSASVVVDQTPPDASVLPKLSPASATNTAAVTLNLPAAGQDEVQVAGAGVSFTAPAPFVLAPAGAALPFSLTTAAEGAKAIAVTYRDLADNTAGPIALSLTYDHTAPVTKPFTVTGALADGTASSTITAGASVTLDLSGQTDALSGVTAMKISNTAGLADANWQPFLGANKIPWTLSPGDGAKTVYVALQDAAGNDSLASPSTGAITLKTQPPTAPSLSLASANVNSQPGWSDSATVNVTVNAAGTPASVTLSENPSFAGGQVTSLGGKTLPYTFAYTLAGTGVRTLYARYADSAGNSTAAISASINVDTTLPGTLAPTLSPSVITSTTAIQLIPPAAGEDFLQLTGAAVVAPTGFVAAVPGAPINVTLSSGDGLKSITVAYRDNAGNTRTLAAPVTITLEATPPVATAFTVLGSYVDGTQHAGLTALPLVTLDFHLQADAVSGLAQMRFGLAADVSDGVWQAFAKTPSFILTGVDGPRTIYAQFLNGAGVLSNIVSGTVTLDTTPPSAPALTLTEQDSRPTNGATNNPALLLSASAGGTPAYAVFSEVPTLSPGTTVSGAGPYPLTYTVTGAGNHTLYARVYDTAGNASALVSKSVNYIPAANAPLALAPLLSPASGVTGAAAISLTVPAAGQFDVQVTGNTGADLASNFAYTNTNTPAGTVIPLTLGAGDGLKTFSITYRDAADNATTVPGLTMRLDTAAPAVPASLIITGLFADGVTTSTTQTASSAVTLDLRTGFSDAGAGLAQMKISNRSDLADANWQPYIASASYPWTLPPGDGAKTVYVDVMDAAGNSRTSKGLALATGAISLLASPPTASSLGIENGATITNKTSVALAIAASNATTMDIQLVNQSGAVQSDSGFIPYASAYALTMGGPDQENKTVRVRFKNATLVEGADVSAAIYWDRTFPSAAGWTLGLLGSLGNGSPSSTFSNSLAVTAQLTPPVGPGLGDVVQMAYAQRTGGSCAATFTAAAPNWQPYAPTATVVLTGGDGAKTICALLRDRAGNYDLTFASTAQSSITLDTTPPTAPGFSTPQSGYTSSASVNAVLNAASDSLATTVRYQCLGGQYQSWSDCTTVAGCTSNCSFVTTISPPSQGSTFNVPFAGFVPGHNVLQVRARDDAYNYGPNVFVDLVFDNQPPDAPTITSVRTASGGASISWSAVANAVEYRVNYGTQPGDTTGTGAAQGGSPVSAGTNTSLQLTGLTNGSIYYVSVVAVDAAGNLSDPSGPRLVSPNVVNPRLVSNFGASPRTFGQVQDAATPTTYRTYMTERQNVVQLNMAGATPQVIGRAAMPNIVPVLSADLVGVNYQGGAAPQGDYLYISGDTLQNDLQLFSHANGGVTVVYFPAGTGVSTPTLGSVVTSLSPNADQVLVSADRSKLFLVTGSTVYIYSLANPARPARLGQAQIPVPARQTSALAASFGGPNTLYVVLGAYQSGSPANSSVRVIGFDVTDPTNVPAATDYGLALRDSSGTVFDPTQISGFSANMRNGVLYISYTVGFSGYPATQLNDYVVTDASWPKPKSALQVTAANVLQNSTPRPLVQTGNHLFLFGVAAFNSLADGVRVTVDPTTKALSAPTLLNIQSPPTTGDYVLAAFAYTDASARDNAIAITASKPVRRWIDTGGASLSTPISFSEPYGSQFALAQDHLYVVASGTITTVDISNPLMPIPQGSVAINTANHPGGNWRQAITRGNYLYVTVQNTTVAAGTFNGVDIFRINADGSLTYVSNAHHGAAIASADPESAAAIAISGRYLFVGSGQTFGTGLSVYDIFNPAAPTWLLHGGPTTTQVMNLDVRNNDVYFADSNGHFGHCTLTPSPIALSTPGSNELIYTSYTSISSLIVRGDVALLSDSNHTGVVNVSSPTFPYFTGDAYLPAGAAVFQEGYVVGLSPSTYGNDGIQFSAFSLQRTDGTLPFQNCGASFQPAIAYRNGVYYVPCGSDSSRSNGIELVSVANAYGGRLYSEYVGNFSLTAAVARPLATDGAYLFFGANQINSGTNYPPDANAWYLNQENALNSPQMYPYQTGFFPTVNGQRSPPQSMVTVGAVDYTVLGPYPGLTTGGLVAYDISKPATGNWPALSSLSTFYSSGTNNVSANGPVATDESMLYLPSNYYNSPNNTPYIVYYDIRDPNNVVGPSYVNASNQGGTVTSGDIYYSAVPYRQKLYVGAQDHTLGFAVRVFDTNALSATSTPIQTYGSGNSGLATGMAFIGNLMIYTAGNTLGLIQLGPALDGAGANRIGELTSSLQLQNPTIVGDLLYVQAGAGLATYDLTPVLQTVNGPYYNVQMPRYISSQGTSGPGGTSDGALIIDGPWAFSSIGDLRVFDLR